MNLDDFAALADPLPEAMLLVVVDGAIQAANHSAAKLLGHPRGDLSGARLTEFVEDPPRKVLDHLRACGRRRDLLMAAVTLKAPGSSGFPCRMEGALCRPRSEEGEAVVMVRLLPRAETLARFAALNLRLEETQREIARRRAAERLLEEQREELRVTLLSIGDAVIVTDTKARIKLINRVAVEMCGWSFEEALGAPLEDVFHIVNEYSGEPVLNPVNVVLREGVTVGLANHTVLLSRDGSARPIDDTAAPIRNAQGEMIGVVLVFRDIQEVRQSQRALRASEERFAAIVRQANIGIAETDAQGRFALVNQRFCDIVGRSSEEVLASTAAELTAPEHAAAQADIIRRTIETGENTSFERLYTRRDGEAIWTKAALSVVRDSDHRPEFLIWIVEDISDRKRLEIQLHQRIADLVAADRQKNEFLAMLAHELRNPLSPLRSGLDLLMEDGRDGETLELMNSQLNHLVRLVDDLLDVARIVQGRIELRNEQIEVATIVRRAVEQAQEFIDSQNHELHLSLPDEPLWIEGDPVRLTQVVSNLLHNAAKYTDSQGLIHLEAQRTDDTVVIRVADNGIGIAPEQLPTVFDLFMQVDQSLARSRGGLGIGLTLVQRIVEMHGGSVTARSAGAGEGSEFEVCLPVGRRAGLSPAAHDSAREVLEGARILLVDDNHAAATLLRRLFRNLTGGEVHAASNGHDGLRIAEAVQPHLIVLDIGLPDISGYDVARALAASGSTALLVALTGYGRDEDRRMSEAAGFDLHLTKPPAVDQLKHLLKHPKFLNLLAEERG